MSKLLTDSLSQVFKKHDLVLKLLTSIEGLQKIGNITKASVKEA